jgi:hypothetical protein
MQRFAWWLIAVCIAVTAAFVVLRTPGEARPEPASPVTVRISTGLPRVRGFKPLGETLAAEYAKVMRFVVLGVHFNYDPAKRPATL